MQNFVSTPKEIFAGLWRDSGIIFAITQRDVLDQWDDKTLYSDNKSQFINNRETL